MPTRPTPHIPAMVCMEEDDHRNGFLRVRYDSSHSNSGISKAKNKRVFQNKLSKIKNNKETLKKIKDVYLNEIMANEGNSFFQNK